MATRIVPLSKILKAPLESPSKETDSIGTEPVSKTICPTTVLTAAFSLTFPPLNDTKEGTSRVSMTEMKMFWLAMP